MKNITKTYSVYKHGNDYYFLSDYLNERLHELLEEKGIIDTNDTSKAGTRPTQVYYSLNYCQGDGAMFEGVYIYTFNSKKYIVTVNQSGHYYHYNSKNFSIVEDETGEEPENYNEVEQAFNTEYVGICKELERQGYDFIEYEDSMESFTESCEANEYTFTKEGIMDNSK